MANDAGLLRRLLSKPSRWPVRWRLAAVSASLTLVILVVFAFIVGRLATDRIRDDFRSELTNAAQSLATQIQLQCNPGAAACRVSLPGITPATDAATRIVTIDGDVIKATSGAPDVGDPQRAVTDAGAYTVATAPIPSNALSTPTYVQYMRPHQSVDETVNRLWLFLGCGVLIGTLLATLAGLAVAGRAMRPISNLTALAREIARTRDPSRRVPAQRSDDEVAELARTLDEMLVELDAARSETEHMVQRQREFVADASHELRTPLTSILANLELLQERLEAEPELSEDAEMVDSALRSSRRMRRLVADLLLLAKADAGRLGAHSDCSLDEIAAAAVREVRPVATDHSIELTDDGAVTVLGNADELHRLAVNLIDNAARHTPAGTTISVSVSSERDEAVLEVSDDGPGLPRDAGDDLFDRFVRGGGAADLASQSGSGLGLAIVQAVAVGHGGSVVAGASDAGGARFTVRLPLVRSAVPA